MILGSYEHRKIDMVRSTQLIDCETILRGVVEDGAVK